VPLSLLLLRVAAAIRTSRLTEWIVDRAPWPTPGNLHDMSLDPVVSNRDHYKVVFENERVRVLEYTDQPGDKTTPHRHPDSVMYTLSSFRRRLFHGGQYREVELQAGGVNWLPAQEHYGENIGETATHTLFVELKDGATESPGDGALGPG
jgi:quercetin dioxygenase-like cupin family protein